MQPDDSPKKRIARGKWAPKPRGVRASAPFQSGLVLLAALITTLATLYYTHLNTAWMRAVASVDALGSQQLRHSLREQLPPHRLLLATHNRLMWYTPATGAVRLLHEGEGVHYGMFPGAGGSSIWFALRPHNWRPATSEEWLVEVDADSGQELRRVRIASHFTHDVVRTEDSVFICDTGSGQVVELAFPSMKLTRIMPLFSSKEHPNTLAPLAPGELWVMLHNLGESDVVRIDFTDGAPREALRIKGAGTKAHGLVEWRDRLLLLDSDNSALVALDPANGQVEQLWQGDPAERLFLKGLAVLDDVAYFGGSVWAERRQRNNPDNHGTLLALDLQTRRLLWRRMVPTAGLLNTIGAPHLGHASTYKAVYTPRLLPQAARLSHSEQVVAAILGDLEAAGYPAQISGWWSSGLPYLNAAVKSTLHPWNAGLQLPLLVANVTALKAAVLAQDAAFWTHEGAAASNAVMRGRESNQDGTAVFRFPWYERLAAHMEPLLMEVLGPVDFQNIIRLQLARMPGGASDIRRHQDSGGYAKTGHRIHIPLLTHSSVHFQVCPGAGQAMATAPAPSTAHRPMNASDVGAAMLLLPEASRNLDIAASASARDAALGPATGLNSAGGDNVSAASAVLGLTSLAQEPTTALHRPAGCFVVPSFEGLVFELNNRVPHQVSNGGPDDRIHLVVDVAETPRAQVVLQPGTVCEYLGPRLRCVRPDGTPVAVPAYEAARQVAAHGLGQRSSRAAEVEGALAGMRSDRQ